MKNRFARFATNVAYTLLFLFAPAVARAEPTFRVAFDSFTDFDSDGDIDCLEPVRFRVSVAETIPSAEVTGSVEVPFSPTDGWSFQPGTVDIDHVLTVRCLPTIVRGNSPSDSTAQVDYSCSTAAPPNTGYVLAFYVTGLYVGEGTSSGMLVSARNTRSTPSPLTQTAQGLASGSQACVAPDVSLRKSDGGLTATPGSIVSYTLTVQNDGSATAQGVLLSDNVPANSTFEPAASSPGWSCSPGPAAGSYCTFPLGTLTPGASAAPIFAVRVDAPTSAALLTNIAIVSAPNDSNPSNDTATDTTPIAPGTPDLSLTKTLSSGSGTPESVHVYALNVRNDGNATAAAVSVSETIPPFTRFEAPASSSGWSCSPSGNPGSTCTLSLGSLAPGAAQSLNFALRIDPSLPASAASITNTACSSTSTPGDPNANNCASVITPLGGSPNLSLSKTLASGSATPGSTLAWSLNLRNTGNREAAAPLLRETVPAHTTFAPGASSPAWSCSPGPAAGSTCTLALPALAAGAQVSRTFAVTVANPLPSGVTEITNTACASDPDASQTCDTIRHPTDASPALVTTKTLLSGSGQPGSLLVYRISVANVGNQAAASVSLTDTVPDQTTFEAASSSPGWACSPGPAAGASCTVSLGSLAGGGAAASRDFAVRIADPLPAGVSAIRNRACASSPSAAENCDEETTPTSGSPVLAVTKRLATENPGPGALLSYEIVVRNTGNQNAASVLVTDQLPPATSFDAASSSPGWVCSPSNDSPSTCSATIPSLAAGASVTLSFGARLAAPLPSGLEILTNTACAELGAQRSCSSTSTPLGGSPLLQIEKTYNDGPLTPGKLLSFRLAITNAGDQATGAFQVSETVPDNTTFIASASTSGWACTAASPGSTCTFSISTLRVGEIRDLVFAVRAADPLPPGLSQISNAACLTTEEGSTCDETSTPLTVSVELLLSDALDADADANGLASTGDTLSYSLTLTNPTSAPAEALTVTLDLDPLVDLIPGSVITSLGQVSIGNQTGDQTVVLTIPRLDPGATGTASFQVLIGAVPAELQHLSSQARVSGTNFADEPSDDPDTPEDDDPTLTPLDLPVSALHVIPTLDSIGLLLLCAGLALFGIRFVKLS